MKPFLSKQNQAEKETASIFFELKSSTYMQIKTRNFQRIASDVITRMASSDAEEKVLLLT